ncbi:MAG: Ldh family oxidoreductase, partial [Rhodospirillaceae bacterium]
MPDDPSFAAADLTVFTSRLFQGMGLAAEKSDVVAQVLVEADLLGHVTHGLQLANAYLGQIEDGAMATDGEHEVVADRAAAAVWDGRYLPGCWLTQKAVEDAAAKARTYGTGTVAIRRSHHIGCLASYLEAPARDGLMVEITCTDPSVYAVPAHGGLTPIFTPDPIGVGIPTAGDPIMIDLSASTTSMGTARLYQRRGDKLPGMWLQDAEGNPSNDPDVLDGDNPGNILPTGGHDHGYKGFALALILETTTQGLSGLGRIDGVTNWGSATQVRVTDPAFFCGADEFRRQSEHMVELCRTSKPRDPANPVRLPGQSGLARKAKHVAGGVPIAQPILDNLAPWSEKLNVP